MNNARPRSSYHALLADSRGLNPARLVRVTLEDHIKESRRALLLMQPGERQLHPELGCGLAKFLFRPLTEGLKRDMATIVAEVVSKQEPRVQLLSVQIEGDKAEKSRLLVLLEYRVTQSQRIDSLKVALQP